MLPVYRQIKQMLTQAGMAEGEASAISFMLIEEVTGLNRTQILTADAADINLAQLLLLAEQVASGTPVQYALGYAYFCGLKFHVNPGVLIPRPETEELVEWVCSTANHIPHLHILDIGTGSGCIAIALAKKLPQARVTALDVSPEALVTARRNAVFHQVEGIDFLQYDILKASLCPLSSLCPPCDVIVSNPPYIPESEAAQMEQNVLAHEPHLALFVPNQTPLLFYEVIARKALTLLTPGGQLFFEINSRFGSEIQSLLLHLGYTNIQLRQDLFGSDRMVSCFQCTSASMAT